MRYFGLQAVKVETAGGSSPGALITLIGIVDAREFRDTVLRQRDAVASAVLSVPTQADSVAAAQDDALLREIHDTLLRIEKRLP